jgi:hypothetical protein
MRLISKKTKEGLPQLKILNTSQELINIINPGERATLLDRLSYIRKNLYQRIEEIIQPQQKTSGGFHIIGSNVFIFSGKEQNIGGVTMSDYKINFGDNTKICRDFVVANTIQESFNKISSTEGVEPDLKEKLKELSEAVADMSNHLIKDNARAATRDLERNLGDGA